MEYITSKEAAKIIGVSVNTLKKYYTPDMWTPGGHRKYSRERMVEELNRLREAKPTIEDAMV